MPSTPQITTPSASGLIDHQITYCATLELQQRLTANMRRSFRIRRTLETVYFDAEGLPLYASGSLLRERGRTGRAKRTTEAKIPTGEGLLRLKDNEALAAATELAGQRPLRPVATQTKHRELLLIPAGRSRLAPDFVVALDDADVRGIKNGERHQRREIELQIFAGLPWTSQIDDGRVDRFHEFCRSCEAEFGLVPAQDNSYQAIPQELLT